MDPKSVKMAIRCGIFHINKKITQNICTVITEALKDGNPRIHSGYTQGYLKIQELFHRQQSRMSACLSIVLVLL
jgi:hypothetical protein